MNKKFFILAAAAMALAACSNDDEVGGSDKVEARITADVNGPKTRAVDNCWNADEIGVMVVREAAWTTMSQKYRNVPYKTESTLTTADFIPVNTGGGIFFENAFETYTFSAYAPYAKSSANDVLPGTDGVVEVNTFDQPTQAKQEKIDWLYAYGATADQDAPTISFTNNTASGGSDCSFKHKMARLILNVQVSKTDGFDEENVLEEADYELDGLVHEGTFNVVSGETALKDGAAAKNWILYGYDKTVQNTVQNCYYKYDPATGVMTFTMILLPQTLDKALTFTVCPDDEQYQEYTNSDAIKPALNAGTSYTYTITVRKTGLTISGCTIENWNDGGTIPGDAEMN